MALLADAIDIRVTERALRYAPIAHQNWQGTGSIAIGAIGFGPEALCARCLAMAASQLGIFARAVFSRRNKEAFVTLGQTFWLSNELIRVVLTAQIASVFVSWGPGLAACFARRITGHTDV